MRRTSSFVLLVLLLFAPVCLSAQSQRPLAFTHAVIIDGNGGAPIENGTLVIRGEKIEAVGSSDAVKIPADAEVKDLKGKVLMPGLADMHVHLVGGWDGESVEFLGYQRYLNALLYSGVTTVMDLGNFQPFVIEMRDEIAAGRLTGPRIYCAGPLLDSADPIWAPISRSITSIEQVPGIVKQLKQSRVDVIKGYGGLNDTLLRALANEARKNSLPLLVDLGMRNGSIEVVLGDNVTSFAHLPDFDPKMYYSQQTVNMMKQREVKFISTLNVIESYSRRRLSDLSFLDSPLIKDTAPPNFVADLRAEATRTLTEADKREVQRSTARFTQRSANAKIYFDAGFLIAAGTDAPYPGVFQGEGLHHELELLAESGLRPLDVITMATRNAAKIVGANDWGTLEAGKRADVLVMNGRPDQKIQDTRNIEAVIQRGKVIDRAKLKITPTTDPGFRPTAPMNGE